MCIVCVTLSTAVEIGDILSNYFYFASQFVVFCYLISSVSFELLRKYFERDTFFRYDKCTLTGPCRAINGVFLLERCSVKEIP